MIIKRSSLLTGLFILIAGIFIALVSYNPSSVIQYVVVICSFLGGIFALLTASKSKDSEIPLKYHWLVGIGLIVYAIAIAFFAGELSSFLQVTSFFLLLFGLIEIIFTFQILSNSNRNRPEWKVMLYKVITGLIMGSGAMWVLTASQVDANIALLFSGLILSLTGLSFMLVSKYVGRKQVMG